MNPWPYQEGSEPVGMEHHTDRHMYAFCRLISMRWIDQPIGMVRRWMVGNQDRTLRQHLLREDCQGFSPPSTKQLRWQIYKRKTLVLLGKCIWIFLLSNLDTNRNWRSSVELAPFDSSAYFCFKISKAPYLKNVLINIACPTMIFFYENMSNVHH